MRVKFACATYQTPLLIPGGTLIYYIINNLTNKVTVLQYHNYHYIFDAVHVNWKINIEFTERVQSIPEVRT